MHINNKKINKRREGGFTLLEIILVVGLLSTIAVLSFEGKRIDFEHNRAKEVGQLLSMYASAAKQWLSDNPITEDTEKKGSLWLKSSECEGNPGPNEKHYLPCHFPEATEDNPISFGQIDLTTKYTVKDEDGTIFVEGITTTSPFSLPHSVDGPQIRSDLAGIAAITAAASSSSGLFRSDIETAVITIDMSSSATVGGADWLRVDGSNEMLASITFDPTASPSEREVRNVSRLVSGVDKLISIGAVGGALSGDIVEVDSNQTLLGTMVVKNSGSEVAGIVLEKGNVVASNGSVIASGSIVAPVFFDSLNNSYFMQPRGNTRLMNIQADGYVSSPVFYDLNNTAYHLNPDSLSNLHALNLDGEVNSVADINTTAEMKASRFNDADDESYYVDPSGTSVISDIDIGKDHSYLATTLRNKGRSHFEGMIIAKEGITIGTYGAYTPGRNNYAPIHGQACNAPAYDGQIVRSYVDGHLYYCYFNLEGNTPISHWILLSGRGGSYVPASW